MTAKWWAPEGVDWQTLPWSPEQIPEVPQVYLDAASIEALRRTLRLFREYGERPTTLRLPENYGADASAMRRLGSADPHAHVSLSSSEVTDEDGTEHHYISAQIFAVSGSRNASVVRYTLARSVDESDFIGEVGHGMRAAIQVARQMARE